MSRLCLMLYLLQDLGVLQTGIEARLTDGSFHTLPLTASSGYASVAVSGPVRTHVIDIDVKLSSMDL